MQSSSNACSPILQFFGTSTCFNGTFSPYNDENAYNPILINVDGNEILVNNLQLLNVSFLIDVTPSGIIQFPHFMLIFIFFHFLLIWNKYP